MRFERGHAATRAFPLISGFHKSPSPLTDAERPLSDRLALRGRAKVSQRATNHRWGGPATIALEYQMSQQLGGRVRLLIALVALVAALCIPLLFGDLSRPVLAPGLGEPLQ